MADFCTASFLSGLGTGAGLIIAIGAQNAFVLKQGIQQNYVFITALIGALVDALMITLGVGGFGMVLASNSLLLAFARWGGVAFLGYYGFRSFRSVFKSETLELDGSRKKPDLKATLIAMFMFSFLNPHVYLDTVVLLGSISAQFPEEERFCFGTGAIVASFVWFFTLGYGARYLAPLFRNPVAWKVLDFLIGCVMWAIALSLVVACPGCF